MRFRRPAAFMPLFMSLLLALPPVVPTAAQTPSPPPAPTTPPRTPPPASNPSGVTGAGVKPAVAPQPEKGRKARNKLPPDVRDSWLIGIGGGFGRATPSRDSESPPSEQGPELSGRVGHAISPNQVVGVELLSWSKTIKDQQESEWAFKAVLPTYTHYWQKPSGGSGPFVRAGLGWGSMKASWLDIRKDPSGILTPDTTVVTVSDDGFSSILQLGYEWRTGKNLALAVHGGFTYISVGDRTGANILDGALNLHWYW